MKRTDYLKEVIIWSASGDPEVPFKTNHNGVALNVRVNNFPAEHLYTLIAGNATIDFDDWPKSWTRPRSRRPARKATVNANTSRFTKTTAKSTKLKSFR